MERVERVDPRQTPTAKESNRYAIDAAESPLFAAEFATIVSGELSSFESNELFEE